MTISLEKIIPNPSARFFYEYAGKYVIPGSSAAEIYASQVSQAYEMAGAERDAQHLGLFGEWELDDQMASSFNDVVPDEYKKDPEEDYPLWICGLANQEGDGEWVTSLSGIDLGPNGDPYAIPASGDYMPYARVVEAELAQQYFDEISQRYERDLHALEGKDGDR